MCAHVSIRYCPLETNYVYQYQRRRSTKMVPQMKNCYYATRLKKLALPSLSYRRKRGDMIEVMINTRTDCISQGVGSARRSGGEDHKRTQLYKLNKKRCSTTRRLKLFSMRVVNAWNSLPVHVVNAVSVNSFKSRIDMCWAHIMFSTELPAHEQI